MPRGLLWVVTGGVAEWFDYISYIYFSAIIGRVFTPATLTDYSHTIALLILAISYIARPVGGVFFGKLSDRKGRKYSLIYSGAIMLAISIVICIYPKHWLGNYLSLFALLLFRSCQAFSMGGQYISSIMILAESGGVKRGGFLSSMAVQSTAIGILLASVLFTLLSHYLTPLQMSDYGWRIPFIISAMFIALMLIKRITITDTFFARKKQFEKFRLSNIYLLRVFLYVAFVELAYYCIMTMLPVLFSGMGSNGLISVLTIVNPVALIILIPSFGYISDIINNKKLYVVSALIFSMTLAAALLIPTRGEVSILVYDVFLIVPLAAISALVGIQVASQFNMHTRGTAFGLSYNLATVFFGGTTPLVLSLLIHEKQYVLIYVLLTFCISIIACLSLRGRELLDSI